MPKDDPWIFRTYAGYANPRVTNERLKTNLGKGQTGLSVAFDLPTQTGYDSDHPMARGEVGKVGVAITSLEDMEELLAEIPLDRVSTSMTINATASILLAFYVAVARRHGIEPAGLSGTIQNDLLKEYIARGTYIYPPKPSLRLIANIFSFCRERVPKWNTLSISAYHIREAGSTAVQEIAFTLANAIAYVQAAIDAGMAVDRQELRTRHLDPRRWRSWSTGSRGGAGWMPSCWRCLRYRCCKTPVNSCAGAARRCWRR